MATAALTKHAPFTIAPITYDVQRELITQLADEYLPLTVSGIDDKAGLEAVHKARMEVKNLRVRIEKRRKELKSESLEYGRRVDAAAKELTDLLLPIESHLEDQEAIVEREKARLAREAEERRRAMIRGRFKLLAEQSYAGGNSYLEGDIAGLSADAFDVLLGAEIKAKREFDARMAAEKAEYERIAEQQRVEAERLAKEKAELERQRQEQLAEQANIEAEKKRLADIEAERQRQAELERAKAEAAEQARLAAIAEQDRKAAEAKAQAEAEACERQRIEALRPDREKLLAVADAVATLYIPQVSASALQAAKEVANHLADAAIAIRLTVEALK